ncbi:AfsR/SARP family transcriptional regulator [Pseudonocardia sp. TRM90224]|uniref:AfsR/SARP family transcriptional regulator n=1 Tax=Pseudonocardia sp. TRM90224 TaxID=2812678 RepID=UPI001E33538A|nr:AfsR/SARP family transcriptional regulator [Pseudonocardia sp. TRM90224]
MEIKVLGRLDVRLDGASITPSGRKPRQVLALLALQAGQVVTVSTLIEELWGAEPPRSALPTLQTYVLRLRKLIEAAAPFPASKDVLTTTYGGYSLDVSRDALDVTTFERIAAAGRLAVDAGRPKEAADQFAAALNVWRGPALIDVKVGIRLKMEVARLEEIRLGIHEDLIDAELRLGRHGVLLGRLAALTARYPMHEHFRGQYMIALYRSGRPARALEEYTLLHRTMMDELGLAPSDRLRRLQSSILNADPVVLSGVGV